MYDKKNGSLLHQHVNALISPSTNRRRFAVTDVLSHTALPRHMYKRPECFLQKFPVLNRQAYSNHSHLYTHFHLTAYRILQSVERIHTYIPHSNDKS